MNVRFEKMNDGFYDHWVVFHPVTGVEFVFHKYASFLTFVVGFLNR